MTSLPPDQLVLQDNWSDLSQFRDLPEIDHERMLRYRQQRLRQAMADAGVDLCLLVSPISQRYAVEYRNYALFQSHIPSAYLLFFAEAEPVIYNGYDPLSKLDWRRGRAISFFDAGGTLADQAELLAGDIHAALDTAGASGRRVAVEYINPTITQSLMRNEIEVVDGVPVAEKARLIKSADEIACIRWAMAVAEHGAQKLREQLRPGVSELQLWALLNYVNCANNGDWHDGRMLASGPRINPWYQEATARKLEAGDLLGFDTDMIGPFGYFADLSRTMFCGPGQPSRRQRQLYRMAHTEIEHNLRLVRSGISLEEFQRGAFEVEEEFHANAYTCILHGVGMSDEYPRINPRFRGATPYPGRLEAGMVVCIESYMGAQGERDGVKLEQQVLVTDDGYEAITTFPYEEALLD